MSQDLVEFFDWVSQRRSSRTELALSDLLAESNGPEGVAVAIVDLVNGFCKEGPLSSQAVGNLVAPIVEFLKRAHNTGLRQFYFPCDAHPAESPEFSIFPPHCVQGTAESELVSELQALEFSHLFRRLDKGSVSSLIGTTLAQDLVKSDVRTVVCAGDCTDLCLYHLAVGLRYFANHHQLKWRIVVPQNLVATYDLPLKTAAELGVLPHPAAPLHDFFLYHLELNGVEVVSSLS